MAWTTPKTWSFEEVPTYTDFNTHIRDNPLHLYGLMDAASGHNHSGANQGPPIALGSGSLFGYGACIPASTSCTITDAASYMADAEVMLREYDLGGFVAHHTVGMPGSGSTSFTTGSIRLEIWSSGSVILTNVGAAASAMLAQVMAW